MTGDLIGKAQLMYYSRRCTMTEIAQFCAVTPMAIYRHINTREPNLTPREGG